MDLEERMATMPVQYLFQETVPVSDAEETVAEIAIVPQLTEIDLIMATERARHIHLGEPMRTREEIELDLYHGRVMRALERGDPVPED